MTVGQLLSSISSREITEWRAYFHVDKELFEEARKKQPPPLEPTMKANLKGYKRK